MKKSIIMLLVVALMVTLCACKGTNEPEQSTPNPNVDSNPTTDPNPVNPYAWLGYDELPVCDYLDEISSQVYYREYDHYMSGGAYHSVEASDGVSTYKLDGPSGILTLNLSGKIYNFDLYTMNYYFDDRTETYQATLDETAKRREQGIDTLGRKYKGTGSEPIPLYCNYGDTQSYEYHELITSSKSPVTQRLYYKDGDVFAIYTSFDLGEGKSQETTQVITSHNPSPNPALFAMPDNFDEYTLQ